MSTNAERYLVKFKMVLKNYQTKRSFLYCSGHIEIEIGHFLCISVSMNLIINDIENRYKVCLKYSLHANF